MAALLLALATPPARADEVDRDLARRTATLGLHGATPRGAVALVGLDEWSRRAPGAVRAFLDRASARRLHALVRDQVEHGRLALDLAEGQYRAAAGRRRALGFLEAWAVVGPFDHEANAGLGRVHPPEQRPADPLRGARAYLGKTDHVRWQDLPNLFPDGGLRPQAVLGGDAPAVVYLATVLTAARAGVVALRLGSSCSFQVWLNGDLLARRRVVRVAGPDQDAVGLRLRAGANLLLVKLAAADAPPRLFARITGPAGGPVAGLVATRPRPTPAGTGVSVFTPARGLQASPRVETVAAFLGSLGAAPRADAGALRDHLVWLLELPADDHRSEATVLLARELGRRAPGAEAGRLLARAALRADERRRALEAAAAADPRDAATREALGDHHFATDRPARAEAEWRAGLAAEPDHLGLQLRLLELARVRRLPELTRAALLRLRASHPGRDDVLRALGSLHLDRGELSSAIDQLGAYARRHRSEAALAPLLATVERRRLRPDAALAWLAQQTERFPDDLASRIEAARLRAARGEVPAALAALREAARTFLQAPDLQVALGRIAWRAGHPATAVAHLRRALALRPEDPETRRALAFLEREREDPFVTRHAVDLDAVLRAAGPARGAGTTEVLRHGVAYRVESQGQARRFLQRIVRIGSTRGAEAHDRFTLPFQPDREHVEVLKARVRRARGGEADAEISDVPLTDPAVRTYLDRQAKVLAFPGLSPGDVVEIQVLVSPSAPDPAFRDVLGFLEPLQDADPIRELRVVLELPASRKIRASRPALPGLVARTEALGDRVVHRWEARNVPAVPDDPDAPGWTETHAVLQVSTFPTWAAVARWYWALVRSQLHADAALRQAARDATRGARTPREQVAAIHRLVVTQVRYVALAFGVHTHKPYAAPAVFARKFGDCKDTAMLLTVLLREKGIVAHPVLLRMRSHGRIDPGLPSIHAFDHVIVYVPSLDLYLDGTAERSGSGELPGEDQGVSALVIDGGDGRLVEIPVAPAARNLTARALQARLAADGSAQVTEVTTVAGQGAAALRRTLHDPAGRRAFVQQWLGRTFPGVELGTVAVSDLADLERPVELRLAYRVPRLALRSGATLTADLGLRSAPLAATLAPSTRRQLPLALAHPYRETLSLVVSSGPGLRLAATPAPALASALSAPGASFRQEVQRRPGELRITRALEVSRVRVTAAEYPAWRRFVLEVDRALAQPARWTGGAR